MIKYLIIGDDARQENLAKLFWTISFRETEKDLKKQIKNSNVIVTPICTANENIILNLKKYAKKGTKIFGGGFQTDFEEIMKQKKCSVYDITQNPDFAEKNAAPTAEGAIEIAKSQSIKELENSVCLILGYGHCGKAIEKKLKEIGARIELYDKNLKTNLTETIEKISEVDIIFNTIPEQIFDDETIKKILEKSLVINIASHDAGFPQNMRFPNIPAKMYPKDAAKIMKDIIDQILTEEAPECLKIK